MLNKRYIGLQLSQLWPCTGEVQTLHKYWNMYVNMLWSYHVVESSHAIMVENGARCSDKNVKNRLIKVDEKTSVSNIIHVSYINLYDV